MCLSIASVAFAESAPVYDADSMQQQFESADTAQDYPPPPAPSASDNSSADSGFVPMQASSDSVVVSPAPNVVPAQQSMSFEQRMQRMEQRLDNTKDSSERIETLQSEVQALRGQIEQLTHQLETVQSQQKSQYADLDKRMNEHSALPSATAPEKGGDLPAADINTDDVVKSSLPAIKAKSASKKQKNKKATEEVTTTTQTPSVANKTAATQPNVAEEQQIYQTAYNLIKAKKYNDAVNALQNMLHKYPSGQFASNAHYWLGELYGLLGKNDKSLTEFNTVVKTYPSSPRVSDAHLKVGLLLASQMKWPDAKVVFKKIVNQYPGTASARLALEQLKQIKQAGH